jgi:CHAT domain-containing protein
MIVAEGKVAQVPFAAVEVQERGAPPQLLVEAWEISMLPSAQAAVVLRRRTPEREIAKEGLAVLADPVFSISDERVGAAITQPQASSRYPRLPFSREEAEAILALKPSQANFKALDFAANVETAKQVLGAYRYVHFSTHAEADAAHPELSALVLSLVDAKGKEQDGMLRLSAILESPVRTQLVVLSACDTAAGREIRAEGIQGLTQAFIFAGARQVISSPWPVGDFVSRQFMPRFYDALLVKGLPPEAALRAAQLSMMRTRAFRDPSKWAVFSLYGLGD